MARTRRPSGSSTASSSRPSGSASAPAQQEGPSISEVLNMPDFVDEGENVSLNPEDALAGRLGDNEEKVTIVGARFVKHTFKRKIGDEVVDRETWDDGREAWPECRLEVTYQRSAENGGFTREETYKWGPYSKFGPSKDGNFARVQPKLAAERKAAGRQLPQPFRTSAAVVFINSLVEAGLSSDELNEKGAAALVGLKVQVSRQKPKQMDARANPIVLVDYIEGRETVQTASASTSESPIVEDSSDLETQATELIAALLEDNDGMIEKSAIPKALLANKDLENDTRGEILKLLRNKSFIENPDAPWTVDGSTLIQQ